MKTDSRPLTTVKAAARRKQRAQRGMTLVEIMVVVAILGLIAAAVAVAVIPRFEDAKRDTAALDIKTIEGALKQYYAKKGNYPDTGTGLKALVDTQILDTLPKDPWQREYIYMLSSGKPELKSLARDGAEGGEGPDADVSNRSAK